MERKKKYEGCAFLVNAPRVEYWNCNVYAAEFSPDGKWMAMGCGGWYGFGALSLVNVGTGRVEAMVRFGMKGERHQQSKENNRQESVHYFRESLTVSGVSFDASGKFIAISTWASSHKRGPCYLFSFNPSKTLSTKTTSDNDPNDDSSPLSLCSTIQTGHNRSWTIENGVGFIDNELYVRSHVSPDRRQMISSFQIPAVLGVDTTISHRHRQHSRMAIFKDTRRRHEGAHIFDIITGHRQNLVAQLNGEVRTFQASHEITAVIAVPCRKGGTSHHNVITGGRDGSIILWNCLPHTKNCHSLGGRQWEEACIIRKAATKRAPADFYQATYKPESVVALCALEDGRFFSSDASGEILEWDRDYSGGWKIVRRRQIPKSGTPRCLAVHPSTSNQSSGLLAVGVKVCEGSRRGYVVCFEIETLWCRIRPFVLTRKLFDSGRATVKENDLGSKPDVVLEHLMTNLNKDLFMFIMSFV